MKRIITVLLLTLSMGTLMAQTQDEKSRITSTYNQEKSRNVITYLEQENTLREIRIKSFLSKLSPEELVKIDTSLIRDITPENIPLYYVSHNYGSGRTIRADRLNSGGSLNLNLNGQNMVAGVWEAENGYPLGTHLDLAGRITVIDGSGSSVNFHATHVTGTIISSGNNISLNLGRGIAYDASVLAANSNNDNAEMAAQSAAGLLISNHSYGLSADGLPIWLFGAYNADAFNVDLITSTNPYYVPVVSAGNDRNNFSSYNPTKGGYDLLTGQSNAKNSITSAAVSQVLNYTGPSSVTMSTFSNWGPTDDGRIKPDISSKGVGVLSTSNTSNTAYANSSGTSMSAPAITGLLLLLQQHYNNVNVQYMLAATAKGLLLHTADEAGSYLGPDYQYGWGLANGEKAALAISNNTVSSYIQETSLNESESKIFNIKALGTEPLMVSISWTDPAGTAVNGALDNTTPVLVNDLDLKLTKDGTDYFPWKLNLVSPSSAATRNATNDVDNFEKVQIDAPLPNDLYSVTINHKASLLGGAQNYSFIITGGILETLGYDEQADNSNINIWPNPASNILNVNFKMNGEHTYLTLYDIQGRAVHKDFLNAAGDIIHHTIDTEKLSEGIYVLQIVNKNTSFNKRIVIKR